MTKRQNRPGKKERERKNIREAAPAYLSPQSLYTLQEACRFLRISESTARRWIKDGRLRARKIGRDYRLLGKELLQERTPGQVQALKVFGPGNPLLELIGVGDSGGSDIAKHKHDYIADAYYSHTHGDRDT
jgi:excisionase family DNA binding protein